MKLIENPWNSISGYNCFACSPDNPIGLHLTFAEEDDYVVSCWTPDQNFQGWLNTLHGGIICTLMDELAGWVVTHKLHTCGVTSQLNTKFKQRVDTTGGALKIRARLRETKRNLAFIDCEVLASDGTVCATAEAVYFTYPREVANTKFFLRTPDEANGK